MKSFYTIILILFALNSFSQSKLTNQNIFDTIPNIPWHQEERLDIFNKEPKAMGGIVFLGNSITEGGDWKRLTGDSSVINRGIGGDITFSTLKRLDEIIERQPIKLFLLIGINDIGKDIPEVVIADNIRKIIEVFKAKSPDTKIYLQTLLSVNPTVMGFPQHYDKIDKVINTNKLIRKVASDTKVILVDLYPEFLNSKKLLDERFVSDGLHLTEAGYQHWVKFLKTKGYL